MNSLKISLEEFGERFDDGFVSYFLFEENFEKIPDINDINLISSEMRECKIYSIVKVGKDKFRKGKYSLREIICSGVVKEMPIEDYMALHPQGKDFFKEILRNNPEKSKELGFFPEQSFYR